MRIAVFVLALIGGIIGILGVIGGFGLAGLASGLAESTGDTATQAEMGDVGLRLLVGFAAAVVTFVGGAAVLARRDGRRWGIVLIVANIVGAVAAGGFYMFGAALAIVAGIIALFVKKEPAPPLAAGS